MLRDRFAGQPFLLAPMAGVTDAAYRIMCRRRGCATATTEMVSVAGLAYASEKTWDLVLPAAEEPQICVQLFGSKPEQFERAAAAVAERVGERLTSIDINMACPARKVITKGEGSALMEEPERAASIVEACARCADVPVTVKIRKGVRPGSYLAPEFAARMEAAGAAAVAVHGRYASQLYTGKADWGAIDDVAARVGVPVIGSGDVFSATDAARMLDQTAASAVFVARGSYGDPWVCGDALALARDGVPEPHRSCGERLDALQEHLDLLRDLGLHMRKARTFCSWYLKGMPRAAEWRAAAVRCESYEEFSALVDEVREAVAGAADASSEGPDVVVAGAADAGDAAPDQACE